MFDRIMNEIKDAFLINQEIMLKAGIEENDVFPEELIEYFSGKTPSDDMTTLEDVLSHRWLLLHELAELKNLKHKGYRISRTLVWEHYEDVLDAHIIATTLELRMALEYNDVDWVKARVRLIPSWLEDPNVSQNFRKACETLTKEYTTEI